MPPTVSRRTERYSSLLPIPAIEAARCHVIGVGAIGHQVARLLVSMGVGTVYIYDPDSVSEENLGPQCYSPLQIDMKKVDALADDLFTLNPLCNIYPDPTHFRPASAPVKEGDIIFCCVDSMAARSGIFEHTPHTWSLYIDVRMGPEICKVLTVVPAARAEYMATLFPDSEAAPQVCTARATPYCAGLCANLAVGQYARFLRPSLPLNPEITFNILALDFDCGKTPAPRIPCTEAPPPAPIEVEEEVLVESAD